MADTLGYYLPQHALLGTVDPNNSIGYYAPPLPVAADITPPTITVVSPAVGTAISRATPWVVDVTDNISVAGAVLAVRYSSLRLAELAWNGATFESLYARYSTRSSISGGYRFTLRREGGWPSAPTFEPIAYDGNVT